MLLEWVTASRLVRRGRLARSSCGASRSRRRSPRASATPRLVPVARGLASPVLATQAPGEPRALYVVEQPGRIRVVERGKAAAGRRSSTSARSCSTAASRACSGSRSRRTYARDRTLLRELHRAAGRATRGRPLPRPQRARRAGQRAADPPRRRSRTRTTTAATSRSAPTGRLWVGLGDGGSGGDPENRAQNPDSAARQDAPPRRPAGAAEPEIVALGLRNPWRFSFDRRTGDLWIGDVGQGAIEEIDHLAAAGRPASSTSAGTSTRAAAASRTRRSARAGSSSRSRSTRTTTAARSPAATSTAGTPMPRARGPLRVRRLLQRHDLEHAGGGRRAARRARPGRRAHVVRRGAQRGELYAVSHDGAVSRFAP